VPRHHLGEGVSEQLGVATGVAWMGFAGSASAAAATCVTASVTCLPQGRVSLSAGVVWGRRDPEGHLGVGEGLREPPSRAGVAGGLSSGGLWSKLEEGPPLGKGCAHQRCAAPQLPQLPPPEGKGDERRSAREGRVDSRLGYSKAESLLLPLTRGCS
jgi:hypothetical protein